MRRASCPPCPRRASAHPAGCPADHASHPREVDPLQRLSRPSGGPSVTQAEPSWSVGSGVPEVLGPRHDLSRASAMCNGPSRPPRLRPQGFSPSRRFPRKPGLRGLRPARLRADLHAATVQDLVSPSGLHPQESRTPSGAAGSLVVRFGAAFECDLSCPDLPGLPPTPASFRPTCTRSAECDLVRPRVRQTSARWPVSLQGSSDVSTRSTLCSGALDSSSPAGTANRAHPRVAPSTSERSSSRVPDSLPRRRRRLVGRGPRGVLPLQSVVPAQASGPD